MKRMFSVACRSIPRAGGDGADGCVITDEFVEIPLSEDD